MSQPLTSVQLIVFGERNQTDFAGVLRAVAAAGYPAFESGNLFRSSSEAEARRLLDETRLQISGAHFGYGDFEDAEKLGKHIEFAQAIGVKHLMCSGVADSKTADGYRQSSKVFNEVGKRLADAGLAFNYHNHAWEFDDLGGVCGMDILAQETDPQWVKFNLDVFWLHYAGQDPAAFIRKHADRTGYFHFKDGRRITKLFKPQPEFLELGRGDVDLVSAMQAAQETGAEWIVVEQDTTQLTPEESIAISRTYLRNQFGI
jgi:sugar phosphate isomerase/epimerase